MAFTCKFFPYTLPLVCIVCTAYLPFIFCAEIRKGVLLSDWDYEDDYEDWRREYLTITKKPYFRWKEFTPPPPDEFTPPPPDEFTPPPPDEFTPPPPDEFTPSIDERDLYTPSSTVDEDYEYWWKKFLTSTEEPDFWRKIFTTLPSDERDIYTPSSTVDDDYDIWRRKHFTTTENPYDYLKKFTWGPLDERDIYPSNTNPGYIAVIVVGLFFILLIFGAGVIYCIKLVNRDMNRNTAALAADSRLTNAHPPRSNINIVPSAENLTGATGNLNNATDRPPSYDVVVLGDLGIQQFKYPEVKPSASIPECPPPKYEEDTVQKY